MQIKLFRLLLLLAALIMTGCSKDDDNDVILNRTYWPSSEMYVRFVYTDGTNVLDAIGITPQNFSESYYNYPSNDLGELSIEIRNERSGKKAKPSQISKSYVCSKRGFTCWDIAQSETEEMLLHIAWGNPDGDMKPAESYDDATIIKLKSKKVFGNDEEHVVKWFFHIYKGKKYYGVYKCEVDGEPHPLEEDLYMRYQKDWLENIDYEGRDYELPRWQLQITGFINLVVE